MTDDDHTHFKTPTDVQSGRLSSTLPAGAAPLGVKQIYASTDLIYRLPILPGEAQIVANILGEKLEAFITTLAKKSL